MKIRQETEPHDCTAGLEEVLRVLRPGGLLVVIDNDQSNGDFAALLEAANASVGQDEGDYINAWWAQKDASMSLIMSSGAFDTPQDLVDVVSMEFPNGTAPGNGSMRTRSASG